MLFWIQLSHQMKHHFNRPVPFTGIKRPGHAGGRNGTMLDTNKLPCFLIEDISSNLGWDEGESIEPYLEKIAKLTPEQALRRFAEWRLGDKEWADTFISGIDALRKAETK